MADISKRTEIIKVSLGKILCHINLLCKKDRKQRMRDKVAENFDESLDIRSFVSVQTTLALLMSLLLSKK